MLTQERVAGYLLERGLLAPAAVLDDELTVRDASSRNRNYRVQTRDGSGYVLKQGVGPDTQATIANEAAVYHRLALGDVKLSGLLPRFGGYDPDEGLLVLELVRGAEDLHTHHLGGRFSASPAAALGRALGLLHSRTRPLVADGSEWTAWAPPPWVLSLHRPDASIFTDVSAAGLELIRIVQRTEGFGELLDGLRATWAPTSLIHGDVKWSNVLVVDAGTPQESVKLIDWESAMVGDPSWDVGSALSQYLSFWLFSIPLTGGEAPSASRARGVPARRDEAGAGRLLGRLCGRRRHRGQRGRAAVDARGRDGRGAARAGRVRGLAGTAAVGELGRAAPAARAQPARAPARGPRGPARDTGRTMSAAEGGMKRARQAPRTISLDTRARG